jgi:hypothetical protein
LLYRHDWSGQCFGRSVTYSDGDAYCNRYSNCDGDGDCNGDCNSYCDCDCHGDRNCHTHADGDANTHAVRRKMFSDTAASSDSSPSPVGRRFP